MPRFFLSLAVASVALAADPNAVHFSKFWDGAKLIPNATVWIEDGKITRVTEGAAPKGAQHFNTGLPGLIDVQHAHDVRHGAAA